MEPVVLERMLPERFRDSLLSRGSGGWPGGQPWGTKILPENCRTPSSGLR